LSADAAKALRRADRATQERLAAKITALATDPFAASKPLKDSTARSARVGDWRILLKIEPGALLVHIKLIETRGQVYRRLP
jgi:mRNA-degrading endonuclease RelE of RelBE toxin-antitoxin system